MSAARSSGTKLVVVAVGGMVATIGIGTIYLPFFADRDKMRGLHEEDTPPTSAMLAQEIKKLQRDGILKGDDHDEPPQPERKRLSPGSMWQSFKRDS